MHKPFVTTVRTLFLIAPINDDQTNDFHTSTLSQGVSLPLCYILMMTSQWIVQCIMGLMIVGRARKTRFPNSFDIDFILGNNHDRFMYEKPIACNSVLKHHHHQYPRYTFYSLMTYHIPAIVFIMVSLRTLFVRSLKVAVICLKVFVYILP